MPNTAAYEMNNFIDIFQVNFSEEKRPKFKTSYLLFQCEFQASSNAGLKSRICFDRLQNFIFVQQKLAPEEAAKRRDPFHDSEKNGATECVPVCEDKSSTKIDLLAWKGNKSK